MELHAIKPDYYGGCYVLKSGDGFTCYGFAVLDRKARGVAEWMMAEQSHAVGVDARDTLATWPDIGTAEHFARCDAIMVAGADFARRTGKRCPAELVPALIGLEGRRVAATVHGERVRFNVGKSTGWLPGHLRLHNRASHGGEILSADSVQDVEIIR